MKDHIYNALWIVGLRDEEIETVGKTIEKHLTRYRQEEILDDWLRTLQRASVHYQHEDNDGYYVIKWKNGEDKVYDFTMVKIYLRTHNLRPNWTGQDHQKPKSIDSIWMFEDVPEEFVKLYNEET